MASITQRVPLYNTHSMTRRRLPHRHDVLRNAARLRTRKREQRRRIAVARRTQGLRRKRAMVFNTNMEQMPNIKQNDMKAKNAQRAAKIEYNAYVRAQREAKMAERIAKKIAVEEEKKKAAAIKMEEREEKKKAAQIKKYEKMEAARQNAEAKQEAAKQNAEATRQREEAKKAIEEEQEAIQAQMTSLTKERRRNALMNDMY